MSGLREWFGVWDRCGNTSFWKRVYPEPGAGMVGLFVDPIDAIRVYAHEWPQVGGQEVELGKTRIPADVGLVEAIGYRVMQDAMNRLPERMGFMYWSFVWRLALGAAARGGWDKGRALRWFLDTHREQGAAYRAGAEDPDGFLGPAREEILTATDEILGDLGDQPDHERRYIPREALDEALADWGVMEC